MSTPLLQSRNARIAVVLAGLWAVSVAIWLAASYPTPVVAPIEAIWAYKRVELLRTPHDKNTPHREIRKKLFGDRSDAKIVRPESFDIATAVPVDQSAQDFVAANAKRNKVVALDAEYAAFLSLADKHIFAITAVLALAIWLAPLIASALALEVLSWVRRGTGA